MVTLEIQFGVGMLFSPNHSMLSEMMAFFSFILSVWPTPMPCGTTRLILRLPPHVDLLSHWNPFYMQRVLKATCYYSSVQCQSFTSEARAIVGWSSPLGCARALLQRPEPLFSHLGTWCQWCVLYSSTSVHIHCSLSIVPFLIVPCFVVSFACVCVCLETSYFPCSVYNLQVGWTNSLVSFPHLQVSSLVSPHWI